MCLWAVCHDNILFGSKCKTHCEAECSEIGRTRDQWMDQWLYSSCHDQSFCNGQGSWFHIAVLDIPYKCQIYCGKLTLFVFSFTSYFNINCYADCSHHSIIWTFSWLGDLITIVCGIIINIVPFRIVVIVLLTESYIWCYSLLDQHWCGRKAAGCRLWQEVFLDRQQSAWNVLITTLRLF